MHPRIELAGRFDVSLPSCLRLSQFENRNGFVLQKLGRAGLPAIALASAGARVETPRVKTFRIRQFSKVGLGQIVSFFGLIQSDSV
jgi:hypothetical protein